MSDSEPATTGPDENVGQGEDVTGMSEKTSKMDQCHSFTILHHDG